MTIRAIFFDLDDTLIPTGKLHSRGLDRARLVLSQTKKISRPDFLRRYEKARAHVKRQLGLMPAARSRFLYFKELIDQWLNQSHPKLTLEAMRAYDSVWGRDTLPGAKQLIADLSRHYILGVITNQMCDLQMRKLCALDPRGTNIKVVVTSEEAGVDKPNPRIFTLACRRAGVRPDQSLMVGDDWGNDVVGAKRAGLKVAWLGSSKKSSRHVICLQRLGELKDFLRREASH